jgi:penicillin amidase
LVFRSRPLLSRFGAFVLLPCAAAGVFAWRQLRATLPASGGAVIVAGVTGPVEIRRDAHGIPYITARTDRDAFFAAGYVHAQDRLWQLEVQRRMVDGRLSEIFGKNSIQQDIWLRTLGLREAAKAAWPRLTPDARESLTAYTAGINAWLAQHDDLPPEFAIVGVQPQPWTVYDSLGWTNMFALTLGGNFREEITRYVAGQTLGAGKLAAFYPDEHPGERADEPVTVTSKEQAQALLAMADLQQRLESELKLGGKYVGSNAWVVSGKLTRDGQAILANDPHLAVQMPSLWYGVQLRGDRLDVSGMTLVGLPIVIFGRNADVAWGGTNMMADQQDLYFERVDPNDPSRYEVDGGWEPFTTRTETIAVRQEFPAFLRGALKPITVKVRATRHGPVISDQFDVFEQPVSLRWSAYENPGATYESLYRLNYARDWAGFNAALKDYVAPALNFLYADARGNIGYVGAGRIPVRGKGEGTLPVPGWSREYDWQGAVPFAAMPRSFNPEKGYIVNANNRVTPPGSPWFISHDWAPPARASRIQQLLQQKVRANRRITVADMEAIQADVANSPSATLVKVLTTVATSDPGHREAIRFLAHWNGEMDKDSVGATIFYAWSDHLRSRIFSDEIRGAWNEREQARHLNALAERMQDDELAALLADDRLQWCDVRDTVRVETCHDAMLSSLESALKDLRKLDGSDMSEWTWGSVHKTRYEHMPFSQMPALRRFFQREIGNGGSPQSVNVASARFRESEGWVQTFGAGFRQIISLGRTSRHLYMNSTGQSGNVVSAHYDDMVEPFRDVAYYPLDRPAVGESTLILQPLTGARTQR